MKDGGAPDTLNALLVQICRLHHARAHGLLDELGLYRGQPPLLHALAAEEGLSHSDLAAQLHVTPATVSKMVHRMEKAGVITTRPDPEDQRVSRVYLTDEGRELHRQAQERMQRLEAETFEGLSETQLAAVRQGMERMRLNLIHVVDEKTLPHHHGHKPRQG